MLFSFNSHVSWNGMKEKSRDTETSEGIKTILSLCKSWRRKTSPGNKIADFLAGIKVLFSLVSFWLQEASFCHMLSLFQGDFYFFSNYFVSFFLSGIILLFIVIVFYCPKSSYCYWWYYRCSSTNLEYFSWYLFLCSGDFIFFILESYDQYFLLLDAFLFPSAT